jgi:hypothetical protein
MTRVRTFVWRRRDGGLCLALLSLAALAIGCSEDVEMLSAKNDLHVTSVADTFKVDAKDLNNVYDQIDTTWVISGPQAHVFHRSFLPHGESKLTIRDAVGTVVYQRALLYNIEATSDSGIAGAWHVTIELFGITGRLGLTLTKEE